MADFHKKSRNQVEERHLGGGTGRLMKFGSGSPVKGSTGWGEKVMSEVTEIIQRAGTCLANSLPRFHTWYP